MGPAPDLMSDAELYARLDALSEIKEALNRANPARLQKIYADVRLEPVYDPEAKAVDASIRPLGGVVPVSEARVPHYSPVSRWLDWCLCSDHANG
ncbi:hypothetical protein GCM10023321_47100 [Pseudonocardia eucalypti]|uniref:Uncharacterized protein n=1 Tax=Pseudonocardia eucalypti TaxID=648755 RepID=A0ABP9QHV3_9PSEU|nr:hypothetical protein [Pseudonocardia eucalypti]